MLNGLSKNIATINLEKGYLEDNIIQEKLNLEWEQFNLVSSELLKSLCIYSNFETIITILNFYFNQPDGVALLNAFNSALYNYGISGTQIYTNVVNDYQQSVQNIQIGNFFIYNNQYLQSNNQNVAFIVYNIDSYFFILNTEIMLLAKFVSEEGDDFGENNIVVMILNSTQPNIIGPGLNITMVPMKDDDAPAFNIKDVSLKICPGELITLVNNNNTLSIAFQGGKKSKQIKKRKFNKSNRFNKKTNKKHQRRKKSYKKK